MYWNGYLQKNVTANNFEIVKTRERKISKFNADTVDYKVKFKNIPSEFIESTQYMMEIMGAIVKKLIINTKPRDSVRIYINHPVLTNPISLPFVQVMDLTADMIVNEISKVVQSNKILTLDNQISFHTIIMHSITGGGGGIKRLDKFLFKKQSVVRINANKDDSLCGLRAIIVGKAAADKDADYFRVRRSGSSLQNRRAIEIASKLGFNFDEKIGIKEIKIIEEYLKDYQFIVIDGDTINEIIYIGPQKEKKIMLYHHNQHFDTIKSLPGFFSKKNYCFK